MTTPLYWIARAELWAALHLASVGQWWAALAARRLGKFSGEFSEPLKREEDDQ